MEYGLGCPRLEGLSVLAVLFLFVRYNFYAYLFQVFSINSSAPAARCLLLLHKRERLFEALILFLLFLGALDRVLQLANEEV